MNECDDTGRPVAEPTADPDALPKQFEDMFGSAPPARASEDWQRGNIQWAAQANAAGKDPAGTRRRLAEQLARLRGRGGDYIAPGSRLVRTWNGVTHEVSVLEQGFEWQGRRYRSLSAIAEAITGTRWSGPRFFGLRDDS